VIVLGGTNHAPKTLDLLALLRPAASTARAGRRPDLSPGRKMILR